MNKLKNIIASLLAPAIVAAEISHSLTSTPDPETELNEGLASRTRKAAELVINHSEVAVSIDDGGTFYALEFSKKPYDYSIIVEDFDGEKPDCLEIVANYQNKRIVHIKDRGLDGNADYGYSVYSNSNNDALFDSFNKLREDLKSFYQREHYIHIDNFLSEYDD